jgi:hypothetical protein
MAKEIELLEKDAGWRPNVKQEPFLALPLTIKEAFYGGGAGSGKSDVLLYYPLVWKWHEHPRFKQVFMRRTFPELRNEIVPRSREIYRRFGASFNKSDMAWTFPRPDQAGGTGLGNQGAIIYLGHCEHEDDVHKYDSMEINLFSPDELTSFTRWIYEYLAFQRVRTSDKSLPAIIRAAGMPGNIGHGWVKKRFIDPAPRGSKIIIGKGGIKRIFIHATQADNPHIDPEYKNSLSALPEAEKNAKLYGSFDAYLGQVFEEFRDRRYPDEPENALHVINSFDIPDWWPRLVVGDWGFAAMTYVLFAAIAPTKRVYVYRELAWRRTKIEEWAPEVKYYIEKEKPQRIVFCKSVAQDRGQEHTILQQIMDALECPVDTANHSPGSRISGKQLLHEYLRFTQKVIPEKDRVEFDEPYSQWILRNKGEAEYKAYLSLFEEEEKESNLPKLQIFKECVLLVTAIKSCVYAKAKDGIQAEDVAEFEDDDPYDTVRYLVDAADQYFENATVTLDIIDKREAVIQNFQKHQDMTTFYMQMKKIESDVHPFGVSRYHRRARR